MSTLDQPVNKNINTRNIILNKTKQAIEDAETIDEALSVAEQLLAITELVGIALAQVFYKLHKKFDVDSDYIFQKLGKTKETVDRYIRVWALFEENIIPDEYVDRLKDRNIRDLIPIGNCYAQGFDLYKRDWEYFSTAPDTSTILKYIREKIKQASPRKSGLRIYVKRNGDLMAYKGNKEGEFVGYLDMESYKQSVIMARERIIKAAGIMKL